jgi:hypothetical protein
MADDFPRDRPHLHLSGGGNTEAYRRPNQKIDPPTLPVRIRGAHGAALAEAITTAVIAAQRQLDAREDHLAAGSKGFYLDIEIPAGAAGVIDQLADRRKHMEVVAVQSAAIPGGPLTASVFVPERAKDYFGDKVEAYRTTETGKGRPSNEPLISRINTVRLATARSLFTDPSASFPQTPTERVWWEVWLRDGRREDFDRVARALDMGLKAHAVRFPEREVVLALTEAQTLDRLIAHTDVVAELRRAKDSPAFFMGLGGAEQEPWTADVLARLRPPGDEAVAVCLLDSGVGRVHPLIEPALAAEDLHTITPAWGANDSPRWEGHGTRMAGVSLYGDLTPVLAGTDEVILAHRLESVRILPPEGEDHGFDLFGAITGEAIARVEIQAPQRRRVVTLAITSTSQVRGRPSSWSAALDQLCSEENAQRLLVVAAGNIRTDLMPADHLVRNDVEPVEDPAQAWNALTVGAFTERVDLLDPIHAGHRPIAPAGELSPRSRTSVSWDRQWPIKPEVVFEGGNLAHYGGLPGEALDDLQLLTTFFRTDRRYFTTLGDTSAAAALAARMAAQILAEHSDFWPETIRGLMVHAAEWTPAMKARIDACHGRKSQLEALLRRYGYGVPSLERALRSARNDLTLIVEDELQPFLKEAGRPPKTRDMKLHILPWPRAELESLGAAPVEVRVTLSYFIEPNPGERGWTRRHRYASHGLRFRMKTATESVDEFRARINQSAREEERAEEDETAEVGPPAVRAPAADEAWMLGPLRDKGSIHSDTWQGTAADLAARDAIGIFPVGGWWKEKPQLERYDERVRYALLVTLRAPGSDVDIYTPVETAISAAIEAEIFS